MFSIGHKSIEIRWIRFAMSCTTVKTATAFVQQFDSIWLFTDSSFFLSFFESIFLCSAFLCYVQFSNVRAPVCATLYHRRTHIYTIYLYHMSITNCSCIWTSHDRQPPSLSIRHQYRCAESHADCIEWPSKIWNIVFQVMCFVVDEWIVFDHK